VAKTTAEAVKRMNIRGIFIDTQPSRDYPLETPLTHIAGFVNTEGTGGSGVEQARHRHLESGQDVRLTLDADVQAAVQALAEKTPAAQVQIVAMNPRTGAILAAAQTPATHAANSPTADPRARTWRSNMDVFEPGGVISPLITAAAFDMGVVKIDTPINTENGVWTVHGIPLRDPQPYAEMTPAEILIKGCNIGMAKIGVEMGTNALHEAIINWGFNAPAATCIPGAGAGTLHPPGHWDGIAITRLPIGHGMACTLMQLMRAYTAFFNDGRMVEPYIIEDGKRDGAPAQPSPVSAGAAALVRGMMERVVVEGTGQAAALEGVAVFGKTAVVQKAISGGYAEDRFQTAFIGGFEREGAEAVLIAVWLDEPVREGESNPAVAVFKTVAERMVHGGN
jgi:cell division protein FtsI (penicillin-binding protein 3)